MSTFHYPAMNAELQPDRHEMTTADRPTGHCDRCGKPLPGKRAHLCVDCLKGLDIIHRTLRRHQPTVHA